MPTPRLTAGVGVRLSASAIPAAGALAVVLTDGERAATGAVVDGTGTPDGPPGVLEPTGGSPASGVSSPMSCTVGAGATPTSGAPVRVAAGAITDGEPALREIVTCGPGPAAGGSAPAAPLSTSALYSRSAPPIPATT